jgi:arylsulfatase A-like enzyme
MPTNILVILSEQQRFDTIGALGNPAIRTPNRDRLAAGGMRFEHAYADCPDCTPSRAGYFLRISAGNTGFP